MCKGETENDLPKAESTSRFFAKFANRVFGLRPKVTPNLFWTKTKNLIVPKTNVKNHKKKKQHRVYDFLRPRPTSRHSPGGGETFNGSRYSRILLLLLIALAKNLMAFNRSVGCC